MRKKSPYSEFFWPVFFCIWTDYEDLPCKSPYSIRMRENRNQESSECGHLYSASIYTGFELKTSLRTTRTLSNYALLFLSLLMSFFFFVFCHERVDFKSDLIICNNKLFAYLIGPRIWLTFLKFGIYNILELQKDETLSS